MASCGVFARLEEFGRVECAENPFGAKLLRMIPEWTRRFNVLEGEVKAVRLYEYGGPENLKYEEDAPDPL